MSASLDHRPDGQTLTLDDHRVTQLLVELRAVRLLTYSLGDAVELRVGVPFTIEQADGEPRRVDPAEPVVPAVAALKARHRLTQNGGPRNVRQVVDQFRCI